MTRHENIIHQNDLDWQEMSHEPRFASQMKRLGAAAKGQMLGCSLMHLLPGKQAWPRHHHFANEEAIYVLDGEGTIHLGDEDHPVRTGDYIALPAGTERAHALENTSDQPLTYLCISTMIDPDVMGYPDSGKIGMATGFGPGSTKPFQGRFFTETSKVPYWQGE